MYWLTQYANCVGTVIKKTVKNYDVYIESEKLNSDYQYIWLY